MKENVCLIENVGFCSPLFVSFGEPGNLFSDPHPAAPLPVAETVSSLSRRLYRLVVYLIGANYHEIKY
jgi:hypothetical protein